MAKNKPRVKLITTTKLDSFRYLFNPLTAGMLTPEMHLAYTANFIAHCDKRDFRDQFSNLYKRDRVKQAFNASCFTIEEFYSRGIFVHEVTYDRLLDLYRALFVEHKAELLKFIELRNMFESQVLKGELDQAILTLNLTADMLGESLWYIRHKILVLSMKGSLQEMQDFAEACKERSKNGFITFLINCFVLIASDAKLHLETTIAIYIAELEEGGSQASADLLSLMFVPRPLYAKLKGLSCLGQLQSFNIIDHYTLALKILPEELTANHSSDNYILSIERFLQDLQRIFSDSAIPSSSITNQQFETTNRLVKLYELDKHDELISSYLLEFENLRSPFAFINLIAKSIALNPEKELSLPSSPIQEAASLLCQLYTLTGSPSKIEDKLGKIIIELQGFTCANELQLCLYKSMPLRYNKNDSTELAIIAHKSCSNSTPLSVLLTSDSDPVLSFKYVSNLDLLPQFRKIKAKIQRSSVVAQEDIEALMSFTNDSARAKDIYETVSACYIRQKQHGKLLELAGNVLSKEPNSYIAFPMNELIKIIEDQRLNDLDALIVIYYYVTKIDSTKEYLLNESYEEFIENNEVRHPSELFAELNIEDEKSLVFFRDISTLETMDFLGTFRDSNDLRAERVRILDHLRDMEKIGSERHRTEVDEIVLQVIVDAGATEFNVAKIDVNDMAIRRGITEEFSSLYKLYKSIQDEREQQVIHLNDEVVEGGGGAALVVGDKNTTLLRMLNLVENAFVNDEKHGLDKNLSTEIRHGFFSNLIRSKPEETNLLTEKGEDGKYESNIYWLSVNALANPEILFKLDAELIWFSMSFNELIAEAEEWMKISADGGLDKRIFNFKMFLEDFEELKATAERSVDEEQVLDYLFGKLWDKTECCMQEMREKLNVDFKGRVDRLFDELTTRLNDAKSGVVLLELMRAVVQTKSDIREDITTASEWFRRNTEYAATARTINDLVGISIECFERVKGIRLNVVKKVNDLSTQTLSGRNLKAFIIAIVNMLENACRHSGFSHNTEVEVSTIESEGQWQLLIKNRISDEVQKTLLEGRIREIAAKMVAPASINMMRKEGGSGLGKAYNQLRSISNSFSIGVVIEGCHFIAQVKYDY